MPTRRKLPSQGRHCKAHPGQSQSMGQCMRVGDAGALSGTRALDRNWPKSSSFCFSGVSSSTVSAIASLHSASGWGANLTLPNPAHVTRSSRTDARLALQRAAARGYTHQGSACVTPPPELAARHGFDCCQRNMLMSAVAGAPDLPDRGVCPRTHHHGPRLASSDDCPLSRRTRRGVLPASRLPGCHMQPVSSREDKQCWHAKQQCGTSIMRCSIGGTRLLRMMRWPACANTPHLRVQTPQTSMCRHSSPLAGHRKLQAVPRKAGKSCPGTRLSAR